MAATTTVPRMVKGLTQLGFKKVATVEHKTSHATEQYDRYEKEGSLERYYLSKTGMVYYGNSFRSAIFATRMMEKLCRITA